MRFFRSFKANWQRFLIKMKFRTEVSQPGTDPTLPETPLWERIHQDKWWYAASVHADNTPNGTPVWARKVWDDIVQIDPDAPEEYRPFWVTRIGTPPMTQAVVGEIKERTAAGFRVIFAYTFDEVTVDELAESVETLHQNGAMPYCVGLWNELEFGQTGTPAQLAAFRNKLVSGRLAKGLTAIHNKYGCKVSPPGFSSFINIIEAGFGAVVGELFADVPGVLIRMHNYGYMQPKHYANNNGKQLVQDAVGMPGVEVVLEETANSFAPEHAPAQLPGIADERGADFFRATLYAGCQAKLPTCHFMLFHFWHHWNDISDALHGQLRRREAVKAFEYFRSTGDIGNADTLILDDPLGKEIPEGGLEAALANL